MEDDIDIEEHDVFDNPKIRDIFPDLSLVKTEAPDEEDVQGQYDEPQEYASGYGVKIKREILSDDESGQNDSTIAETHNELVQSEPKSSELDRNDSNTYFQPNANYESDQNENIPSELEENGETHCGNKIILGSKPAADYDALYEEALHSNVSVYLENWENKLMNSSCFCNDCAILFPTVNALDAHNSMSHSFLVALATPRPNTARKSTTNKTSRYCNHCNKIFPDDTALIKHLYELLPLNNFTPKPAPEPLKVRAKSTQYKCLKCKKYFSSLASGREHKRNVHPTLTNVNVICKVHVNVDSPTSDTVKKEYLEGTIFATDNLIPLSVLFQCHVCQINFVSCYSAIQHAHSCKSSTEYTKCQTCKRKIRSKDDQIHRLQHKFAPPGEKLRIYTLQKFISEKVYHKCPKCGICFDERTFRVHYRNCENDQVNFIHCNICRIDINKSRYQNHSSKHRMHKYTKKDFIVIKFYDVTRSATAEIPNEDFKPLDEKTNLNISLESDKIPLYYCQICGSYKTMPSPRGHKDGACKSLIVQFCALCGLGFSRENFRQHREHHNEQLTLNDFQIINLQSGEKMEMPISNFHCCKDCKIHFLSKEKLEAHECANEAYEFCQICNKKFNRKAIAPHSNFHIHSNMPELLKMYNSINDMWNVVYMCTACSLVTISYDSAVEHSQNHINHLPAPLSNKCNVCGFDIIEKQYKSHMKLHTTNVKIDRTKFRVLPFNFVQLYSSDWMTMFSSLPKAHKYQILARSIYRFSRLFKFNCEINSGSDDIKIFCKKCKTEVNIEDTKEHYFNKNCTFSSNYVCKICKLHFNTLRECTYHEAEHDEVPKTFKVITFNDQKDELFDQRLKDFELGLKKAVRTKSKIAIKAFSQTKSSKLIKGYPSSKLANRMSKFKIATGKSVKSEILSSNRIKLYKCEKCGSCVSHVKNVKKHNCGTFVKSRLRMCTICKEYFYMRHLNLHMELHRQFSWIQEKPLVVSFDPDSNRNLPVAVIFQCDCGLHFTSKQTIDRHLEICSDDLEISKETCSKCNLLFPTSVLVTHLCKHHSKPVDIRVQIVRPKKSTPFKCANCGIIYSEMASYDEHVFNCKAKNGVKCAQCKLEFDPKTFSKHKCMINEKISVVKKSLSTSVVFRCNLCNLSYLNPKSVKYHFERNHVTHRDIVSCPICKLRFTAMSYTRHKKVHIGRDNFVIKIIDKTTGRSSILKGKNNKLKEVPITKNNKPVSNTAIKQAAIEESPEIDDSQNTSAVEPDTERKNNPYRVYRCSECETCYVLLKRLQRHLASNHVNKRREDVFCKVCGLKFQKHVSSRHMQMHETSGDEYKIKIIESHTGKITIHTGKNFIPGEKTTPINKRSSDAKECSVSKRPRRSCQSNRKFSDDYYDSQDEQPSTSKFGIESVTMTEDNDENTLDIESIDSYNTTDDPLGSESILPDFNASYKNIKTNKKKQNNKTASDAHVITERLKGLLDANMSSYNSTLYQCRLCRLHFITDGSVLWHVSRDHNRTFEPYNCEICGFNFTYYSLQRHIYIHHKIMKLDKDSFNIQIIDETMTKIPELFLPNAEEIVTADEDETNQMSIQPNVDDTENVENGGDTEHLENGGDTERLENGDDTEHLENGDDTEHLENGDDTEHLDTENVASIQDAKIHYYKCGECNVCFVDEETCRDHCIPHVYLDPKMYIECKICNFQFLIDSLKTHVNVHHVEEFFLEDVVITEYNRNEEGNTKVEVYQGIDKVQSRLVSTTTDVATNSCDDIIGI